MYTWLSNTDACDWLRVPSDNAPIVDRLLVAIPHEIEVRTGYDAELVPTDECHPLVRELVMFMLSQRFDIENQYVDRVVSSLLMACQTLSLTEV